MTRIRRPPVRGVVLAFAGAAAVIAAPTAARAQVPAGDAASSDDSTTPTSSRQNSLLDVLSDDKPAPAKTDSIAPTATVQAAVQKCFQDSQARDASYQGRFEVQVHVTGARIDQVTVLDNQTGDPALPACVQGALLKLPLDLGDDPDDQVDWVFTSTAG